LLINRCGQEAGHGDGGGPLADHVYLAVEADGGEAEAPAPT
jgi:hypothetical protein